MARTTPEEVKQLLAPFGSDVDMTIFIDQASMLVDEELVATRLSANRLKYIELNLAAHFAVLSIERGGLTYQKMGDSGEGYAVDRNQVKLSGTRFGQQALTLDNSGRLAQITSPGRAEFRVV